MTMTLDLITEIIGQPLANEIGNALDCVEIAEELIAQTIRRHPSQAPALWDSFTVLMPRTFLLQFTRDNPPLYRSHVQELLQRAMDRESFVPATKAEMLCALSNASMGYPLGHNPSFVMVQLFKDVLPEAYEKVRPDFERVQLHEVYKGASDETLAELRHKLRDENRKHKLDLQRWFWVSDEVKQSILAVP